MFEFSDYSLRWVNTDIHIEYSCSSLLIIAGHWKKSDRSIVILLSLVLLYSPVGNAIAVQTQSSDEKPFFNNSYLKLLHCRVSLERRNMFGIVPHVQINLLCSALMILFYRRCLFMIILSGPTVSLSSPLVILVFSYFQLHQTNFSSHPVPQINITYCSQPEAQKALQRFSSSKLSLFYHK